MEPPSDQNSPTQSPEIDLRRQAELLAPPVRGTSADSIPSIKAQSNSADVQQAASVQEEISSGLKSLISRAVKDQPISVINLIDWNSVIEAGHNALSEILAERSSATANDDAQAYNNPTTQASPLIAAAKKGNVEVVKTLLKAPSVRPAKKDHLGLSAFWHAVERGHESIALLLLEGAYGIDPKEENVHFGETAFFRVCKLGWLRVVDLILSHGQDTVAFVLNKQSKRDGTSPLHAAINSRHHAVVRRLLAEPQIDVNAVSEANFTPLLQAIAVRDSELVRALLEHPQIEANKVAPTRGTALYFAAYHGYDDVTKVLLSLRFVARLDINDDGSGATALFTAAQRRQLQIVKLLLDCEEIDPNKSDKLHETTPLTASVGVGYEEIAFRIAEHPKTEVNRVDKTGASALARAIECGCLDTAMSLLSHPGIDPHQRCRFGEGGTPLWLACMHGQTYIVNRLLELHADVSSSVQGVDCFWIACQENQEQIIRDLLCWRGSGRIELNVNKKSDRGATPLFVACDRGHASLVELLLNECPDIDVTTRVGHTTILIDVVTRKHLAVLKTLLRLRPQQLSQIANDQLEDGKTAVWIACSHGDVKMTKALCTIQGIDPNIPAGPTRKTPLHVAAAVNHDDVICTLFEAHAERRILLEFNAFDEEGYTPLALAMFLGSKNVAPLLLHHNEVIVDANAVSLAAKLPEDFFSAEDKEVLEEKYQLLLEQTQRMVDSGLVPAEAMQALLARRSPTSAVSPTNFAPLGDKYDFGDLGY